MFLYPGAVHKLLQPCSSQACLRCSLRLMYFPTAPRTSGFLSLCWHTYSYAAGFWFYANPTFFVNAAHLSFVRDWGGHRRVAQAARTRLHKLKKGEGCGARRSGLHPLGKSIKPERKQSPAYQSVHWDRAPPPCQHASGQTVPARTRTMSVLALHLPGRSIRPCALQTSR